LATLTQELESSLERHASGSRLPAHDEDEMGAHGFGPLMRFLFVRPFLPFKLRVASSVMGALPFLRKGLASLLQGKLNVDVLDAAAIGVSLLRRDFRTVTVLTLLLGLGEALEYWTRRRSMDSLTESLALNVDTVWVLADGVETSVPLSDVREGDLVVVRDGGSIPVDGIVEDGEAVVNQASMTGEPLGVARSKGAAVYSGTVVEQGHLVIRATHVGDGTRLKQVVRFIEESEALKAGIQGKFERMADMAVPFTFALAGLVWLITRNPMQAASVLLVDYSCALRLATPLAVLAAMREGARHGVVIKGGRFLEALSEADTVVFDKTGTLTNASPHVVEVIPAAGHDRDEVLRLAACLEEHFPHPVARAVVRCAQEEGLQHEEEHAQVEYVVAHGIASTLYGKAVRVGSRHYMRRRHRPFAPGGGDRRPGPDGTLAALSGHRRQAGRVPGHRGPPASRMPAGPQAARRAGLPPHPHAHRRRRAYRPCRGRQAGPQGIPFAGPARRQGRRHRRPHRPRLQGPHGGRRHQRRACPVRLPCGRGHVLLTRPDLSGLITARLLGRATLRRIHINFAATMLLNSMFLAGGLFMILTPGVSALLHNLTTLGVTLNAMRPHLPGRHARQLEAA